MRKIIFMIVTCLPMIAFSMTLGEARASGMVAENDHGYIEAIVNSDEVASLVNEVNAKRREEYMRIAKNTGTSLEEVEKVSAKKIIDTLANGTLIKVNGQLSKK
jgi:uncharacterized protein YdbL (DUF1318 family)